MLLIYHIPGLCRQCSIAAITYHFITCLPPFPPSLAYDIEKCHHCPSVRLLDACHPAPPTSRNAGFAYKFMAADLSLPLETLITAAASKANGWLGDPPPRGYDKPPTPSAPSGMAVREIYIPSGVTVDNQPDVDNQPEAKLPSFELQILRLRWYGTCWNNNIL